MASSKGGVEARSGRRGNVDPQVQVVDFRGRVVDVWTETQACDSAAVALPNRSAPSAPVVS